MPRIAREFTYANFIHIVTEGIKKEYIFYKNQYKSEYIKLLKKYIAESKKLNLLAYCIMSNHAHILIYTEDINEMIKLMRKINTTYAIYYNKEEERVGYVFANRYYSQPIKNETHLFTCIKYIHNNPIKAGVVKNTKEYKFSSFTDFNTESLNERISYLIFGKKDYLKDFHNIKIDNTMNIIDVSTEFEKESKIENLINKFCTEYKLELNQIKNSNSLILKFKEYLNQNFKVNNKTICGILGIGKNRIKYIENKEKKF